jgi:hypothetical protein
MTSGGEKMQTMEVLIAILLLFYAGYVTGKEIEHDRMEKRIKRGFIAIGNSLYFCFSQSIAIDAHIRNAAQEEVEE